MGLQVCPLSSCSRVDHTLQPLSIPNWKSDSMTSENPAPFAEDPESATHEAQLWLAFRCGFATGRVGKYYAELPAISERAARTEFEQFYRGMFSDRC